jgi:hypothetical protein
MHARKHTLTHKQKHKQKLSNHIFDEQFININFNKYNRISYLETG